MNQSKRRLSRIKNHLIGHRQHGNANRLFTNTTANTTDTTTTTATATTTTTITTHLDQADHLETLSQHQAIIDALTPLLAHSSTPTITTDIAWRLARAHERMWQASVLAHHKKNMQHHFQHGLTYSQQAVHHTPRSGPANKWRAIYLGMEAEIGGVIASAKNVGAIDAHLRTALLTLTNDSTLYFMLGRITFSCASATWSERTAAKVVGYAIPQATFAESVRLFRQALSLDKNVTNCLWLGKALFQHGKRPASRKWWTRASKMTCKTKEDVNSQQEAKMEMAKHWK